MDPENPAPPSGATDDRLVRAETCNRELKLLLEKYNCVLCVVSLNIQTGKIFPQVEVISK